MRGWLVRAAALGAFACALLGLLASSSVRAETLEPLGVQYDVTQKKDQSGSVCFLNLVISNFPNSPEGLKFSIIVAYATSNGQTYTGFIVDVGDMTSEQGLPAGMTEAPLSSAEFFSSSFNSPGRLYGGPLGDGGVQMTTNDPPTEVAFITAVAAGDFLIQFTRLDSPSSRAYHVAAGPNPEVLGKFTQCTNQLLPP